MMRALQRIAALCLVAALGTWLFYIGREHQIFLDNKSIEAGGRNFRALPFVRATVEPSSVPNAHPIELMPRDRDLAKVVGPSFRLKVEVLDEFGEEVEKVIERELKPGFSKDMMLSMPLLAADREDYILPPPTARTSPPEPRQPAPSEEQEPVL
jgi:hypothetical protein